LFSGALTVNGQSQAITGVTSQGFPVGGAATGTTAYNSAYTPFYFSDSEQILRSDDLNGTNLVTYGSQGSGVGQFYGAYGIALDSAGRIYIADTYNSRIVRMDDMHGTNWTTYGGTYGSGPGAFYDPSGIAIDSLGRIYVMDTGNSQIVRMDDMNGTNWVAYGSVGSGVGQFAQWLTSIAVDSSNRIYIADTGNQRIVRIDDMTGANWTALTSVSPAYGVTYSFNSPVAVAVDSSGKIYVADDEPYQPAVVRVDDMTGTNWTSIFLGSGPSPHSIALDSTGAVYTGGYGVQITDNMAAVVASTSNAICPYGCYYIFGLTPIPLPSPRPSALSFSPPTLTFTQNLGTSSTLPITVTNFGGSPLDFSGFSASGGFSQTNNCPSLLPAGSNCTVSITFTPSVAGAVSGSLTVNDDSGNLGVSQTVTLTGTGTAPVATVTPASLSFSSQVEGTTSNAKRVTVQNTGTGPMQVTSVTATAPFSQTNTCNVSIAPGFSCTVSVTFAPIAVGSASGTLTITDNAGTQTVPPSGNGSAPVSLSSTSLNFGTLAVGDTSTAKTVTLTNRTNAILSFSSIVASGSFAIASNTCGGSIAAGANCVIGVTFTPAAIGAATGALTFADSALNSPQTVSLTGSGSAAVTLSSTTLSFSTVVVGNTSSAKTVSLTNHENVSLNFVSIVTTAGFVVSSNTCGTSIAAGASCTVGVTFSPTAIGAATGTLTFADDAPNSAQTVSLTGSGSAPVTLSSSSLSLGSVTVGHASSARTVMLTNHKSSTLNFSGIVTSVGFAVSSNTCGTSIAAGAQCTVGVTFSPTAVGAATGTLTFTDDVINSPQTVILSGTGK
jgi:sugar lactone lactonase YvrE